jgi:hypothetical protein
MITLGEALKLADDLPTGAALFLPLSEPWKLDTPCAWLEADLYDTSDVSPPFAQQHGLGQTLSVFQVEDIVSNARQQVVEPSLDQLLAAFLFYYNRDAFIDLTGGQKRGLSFPNGPESGQ